MILQTFTKNEKDFIKYFKQLQEWICFYKDKSKSSFRELPHMHPVESYKETIIKKIINKHYEGHKDFDNIWMQRFDTKFWQLGFKNGFRVIGIFGKCEKDDIFTLLILDIHHLIYPDQKHNNKCINHNDFSVYYRESK